MKTCPYCNGEIAKLLVVREAIKFEGDAWKYEKDPCPVICCLDCGCSLDATDLDILGVPHDVVREATK